LVDEAMEVSGKVVEVGDKDVVGSVVGDDRADDRLVYLYTKSPHIHPTKAAAKNNILL